MLRVLLLSLLTACSLNTIKKGGNDPYVYRVQDQYAPEELKEMAPKVVTTLKREPKVGTLKKLFSKDQAPIKRVGIVVFETMIQNTFTGLAEEDRVYLSDQGKQLLTEKLLSIWEQTLPLIDSGMEYVSTSEIKKTKDFSQYGASVENHVGSRRDSLAPDDVFFLEKGKKTSMNQFMNPRGMRDVSFLLVPATELMAGPKWSEQNKHFINDIAKNLNLDAVIIVQSTMKWTKGRTEKNSGELIPEQAKVAIEASILLPLTRYHERLKKSGDSSTPNLTMCYRTYEGEISFPVNLSMPKEDESFETAMKEIVTPVLKSYTDLSYMTMTKIADDFRKTR